MIKLVTKEIPSAGEQQLNLEQYERLEQLVEKQRRNGLASGEIGRFAPMEVILNKPNCQSISELVESFPLIEKPNFPQAGETFWRLPKLIMVPLSNTWSSTVHCFLRFRVRSRYEAALPVIPATAQELVRRFKNKIKVGCQIHMIFQPSWKYEPQADPVLVACVNCHGTEYWFKIAEWDGDRELINELLTEIK